MSESEASGLHPDQSRGIEFSNDGVRDSLTLTLAPELFHQGLMREVSASKRNGEPLTVLSIVLRTGAFSSIASYQQALIEIAHALKDGLRGEDFFSRASDHGFWVLIHTDEDSMELILQRLELPHRKEVVTQSVQRGQMEYQEWIRELDRIHFR